MKHKMKRTLFTLFLMAISLVLTGCADPLPGAYLVRPGKPLQKIDPKDVNRTNPIYKLNPRDLLLIQVQMAKQLDASPKLDKGNHLNIGFIAPDNDKTYHLVPGDELSLAFPDEEEGYYDVSISPDGSVSLPRTGKSMQVSGLTLDALKKSSIKEYRGIFLKPKLVWSIKRTFNDRLEKMSGEYAVGANGNLVIQGLGVFNVLGQSEKAITEKISSAATAKFKNKVLANVSVAESVEKNTVDNRIDISGVNMYTNVESRPSRIAEDGNLFVPTLGNIQAKGKTIGDLRNEIKNALQPHYQNPIHVNVTVQEYAENKIFIGGEVRRPGRYEYSNKLSLLKLIAFAGWSNENADMSNVLLLRAGAEDNYTIYRTNLDEVMEGLASSDQDFKVSPQDLIIVPPTDIVKKNRFVKQYIRNILPFGTNVSYNINRQGFLE